MKKNVTAMEARKSFGNMLNEVSLKDDKYIINRAGKPIAAVVSINELKRMEQSEEKAREEYSGWVKEMHKKFKGVKPKEIDKLVNDAVRWARKQPA